jgi:rfaE bifunctional protein kinase chain/domain
MMKSRATSVWVESKTMRKKTASIAVGPEIIDSFRGRKVIVLGDVMLDRYWFGTVNRISPEAPVPIVYKRTSAVAPGGAANVAANIVSLGGIPLLVGITGDDEAGRELREILEKRGISPEHILADPRRPTTVKTRIIAHSQHVVRVDEERTGFTGAALQARVYGILQSLLSEADLLVISDYAKGLISPSLVSRTIRSARGRGRRVVVDPKAVDYTRYNGAFLLTPNRAEALTAARVPGGQADGVVTAGGRLLGSVEIDAVLITQGEEGMTLFERGRDPVYFPAMARTVYDVTGAGDTVVATVSLALAAGVELPATVELANLAAGMAVERVGTTAVSADALRKAVRGERAPAGSGSGRRPGRRVLRRQVLQS